MIHNKPVNVITHAHYTLCNYQYSTEQNNSRNIILGELPTILYSSAFCNLAVIKENTNTNTNTNVQILHPKIEIKTTITANFSLTFLNPQHI